MKSKMKFDFSALSSAIHLEMKNGRSFSAIRKEIGIGKKEARRLICGERVIVETAILTSAWLGRDLTEFIRNI